MPHKSVILIRTKKGLRYSEKIRDYLKSLGINAYIAEIDEVRDVLKNNNLTAKNTLIHSRTAGPITNEKIVLLEKEGFKIINSARTLELTSNKFLSQEHARKSGIPVADTYKVFKNDFSQIKDLLVKYGSLVVKPIHSQGQGIYCNKIGKELSDAGIKEIVSAVPGDFVQIQQLIDYKKLIRIIVIGYKALEEATIYDEPAGNWKCSVCLNPMVKKYEEGNADLMRLAGKTAKAFGAQINFIDFFEDRNGKFILNEINTACSLIIHEEITGVAIHRYIGDFLAAQAEFVLP